MRLSVLVGGNNVDEIHAVLAVFVTGTQCERFKNRFRELYQLGFG